MLAVLDSGLKEVLSPLSKQLSLPLIGLTPTEIQVAALVKSGKTNKEISHILNKSVRAVASHRENIRKKLGIKNKKINLRYQLLNKK